MTGTKGKKAPPSILVAGYFGEGNLGDEAILHAFIQWRGEHLPGAKITAISSRPLQTSKQFQIGSVGKNSFLKILGAARSHDAVVFPGGGILQDATSLRSIVYYAAIAAAARCFRKGVFFLNQGVGPLNRPFSRRLTARIATRWAEEFTVRDEASATLLQSLGVPPAHIHTTADITLLLKKTLSQSAEDDHRKPGEPLLIGISLRPHGTTEYFTRPLLDALKKAPGDKKLRILNFQEGADEKISREFAAAFEGMKTMTTIHTGWGEDPAACPAPYLALESLRKCHVLIGMRLHSLIFSALCGVPFIGLAYDPKVKAFCDSMGRPCVAPGAEGAEDVIAGELARVSSSLRELRKLLLEKVSFRTVALEKSMSHFARSMLAAGGPRVLGVPYSTMSFRETLAEIDIAIKERKSLHIVTLNPEMVMLARRDRAFAKALRAAELLTPDGVGIRIAARARYGLSLEKVAGIDLVESLLSTSRRKNQSVFFLGSKPEVVASLVEKLNASPEPPVIAGWQHGYFSESEEAEIITRIRDARPDILLVGMGAPLQDIWIERNRAALGAPVMMGVGGCFDVLSGAVPRAPVFFQKTGLEWLHRLTLQPRRAGRMAVLPRFLAVALIEAFRSRVGI